MKYLKITIILTALCLMAYGISSCNMIEDGRDTEPNKVTLRLNCGTPPLSKSSDPDEELISDLNIFIFNFEGKLEECIYLRQNAIDNRDGIIATKVSLLHGMKYSIYVCANFGYRMETISSLEDLKGYRYHIAYPDEYKKGIPMCGQIEELSVTEPVIDIEMYRLMSKISVAIDRSRLRKGVDFIVRSIEIGNCPKSVSPFAESHALGKNDIFNIGFMKSFSDADGLNRTEDIGMSEETSVYMLENMNGTPLGEISSDRDKIILDNQGLADVCSYIELKIEYKSETLCSPADEYLVYRFYLGENTSNFDIRRNCHYHFTVCPEGDGLDENSWRVDQSALVKYGQGTMVVSPGKYIEGKVGETLHIRVQLTPEGIPLDLGIDDMEYDKSNGIYDYEIDPDGQGVKLHLLKRGSGLIVFECGYPPSDSALIVIVVN